MKINYCIILFLVITYVLNAQTVSDIIKFPGDINVKSPVLTSDLLNSLKWESLEKINSLYGKYHTSIEHDLDSILTIYKYSEHGMTDWFQLVSYKNMVLEFDCDIPNAAKSINIKYFDKNIWLEYTNTILPDLPEKFKLNVNEPSIILKAYYQLLGVNTNDEYGWICECSSVGVAPGKREAVIQLLSRIELLWKLFDYPNTQTRMYAADALIYKDYLTKKMIDKEKKKDSEYSNGIIENLKSKLMTKAEWQKIFNLRDSNLTVKTCGNTGSSKIYDSTTSGLLSDKAIDEIPGQYKLLEDLGYLRGYIYNE